MTKRMPFTEFPEADWRQIMATNLDGPFLCSQACVPLMLRSGGGAIVNIASISGLRASTMRAAYGTSKAALLHMTRIWQEELGSIGVRSISFDPGDMDTPLHAAAVPDADRAALKSPATSARELVELIEDMLTKMLPCLAGALLERAER